MVIYAMWFHLMGSLGVPLFQYYTYISFKIYITAYQAKRLK